MFKTILGFMIILTSFSAWGESRTVILELPTMNCALCTVTIGKALNKVDGVTDADVSYEKKQAIVIYDDAKITVQELISATGNAGFPSTVKRDDQ